MVSIIGVGLFFLGEYGVNPNGRPSIDWQLPAMVIAPFLGHIANRLYASACDPVFLSVSVLLNWIGWVMIRRLSPLEGHQQVYWTLIGITLYCATIGLVRKSDLLDRYRYLLVIAGIGLLLTPLVPGLGQTINGEKLWIRVGTLSFQPVEAAKLLLAVFTASYLAQKRDILARLRFWELRSLPTQIRALGPLALAWVLSLVVMAAQKDVGISLLLIITFIVMIWLASANWRFLAIGAVLLTGGLFVANRLLPQVSERMTVWIDPWRYAQGIGYQIIQAQYSLGTGGLTGTGIGQGHPTLIPVVTSDFIFAAIGEELGLLGTSAIILCFLLLVGAGLRAAMRARTDFSSLTAASFTFIFGLQTLFILGGVTRLLPLTGVTLPFVAYGGSSLVANYVLIAILGRISSEGNERPIGPPR